MAVLVAIRGPSAGKRYSLSHECVLGRSFNSDVYVGDLNVSRRHARILLVDEGAHDVEDLGSGNGTFVNDRQVTRYRLRPNDVIRIGGSSFRYEPDVEPSRWGPEVLTVVADAVTSHSGELRLSPTGDQLGKVSQQSTLDSDVEGRALKMLEAMYAVADAIGTELDLDKLLEKILAHLFDVFAQAERGFVLLVNAATGQLVPEAVKQRGNRAAASGLKFSQTLVDQLLERGHGMIRGNTIPPNQAQTRPARPPPPPGVDDGFITENSTFSLDEAAPSGSTPDTPSATQLLPVPKIGAPLICRGQVLGTLHLEGSAAGRAFSQEDLALLSAIARQAAVGIANARAGQALLVQQRLEADLRLARKIQESFLPQKLPQVPGLQFEAHYVPALHVGGDFYDIIGLGPTRIGILVGDISGKGVSAALLMAKLTSDIRLLSRSFARPSDVLTEANRMLMESGQDAMFATVLYIVLDLERRTFTVANAGHQPPLVCSRRFSGISELDDCTAVALGVVPDTVYPQEVYQLVPGDVVLLYTDGINEAMNRHGQEYGMQRLRLAAANGAAEPAIVLQRVVADVRRFVGSAAQSDDQTLVAFGLTAAAVDHTTGPIPTTTPRSA